jgi:fucose 4-O-acetylase-like acetyltransferase
MATKRSLSLDAAKFLAAVFVICIHACRSPELEQFTHIARMAVPFFAAAAGYGLVRSFQNKPLTPLQFTRQRFTRLYLPFVVWSVAYVLFKLAKLALLPSQPCDLPGWEFLWLGGAYHLWFIPFLMLSSALLYPCLVFGKRSLTTTASCCVFFASTGLLVGYLAPSDDGSGHVLVLIAQALPALFWGFSLGWLTIVNNSLQLRKSWLTGLLCLSLGLLMVGPRGTYLENVTGLLLLILVVQSPSNSTVDASRRRWQARLLAVCASAGQVAMGIYFCHLMILKIGEAVLTKLKFEISPFADLALLLLTIALSTLIAQCLAVRKSTRWLVA